MKSSPSDGAQESRHGLKAGAAASSDASRRRLAGAVLAAGVLHGAVILQMSPAAGGPRVGAMPALAPALSVRVVVPSDAAAPAAADPAQPPPRPPSDAVAAADRDPPAAVRGPDAAVDGAAAVLRAAAPGATAVPAVGATPAPEAVTPATPAVPREAAPAAVYPPLAAAPDYAQSGRLDPGPRPLDDIVPEYPEGHRSRTGSVVVRILVAANGTLDDVSIASATPPGLYDRAAVEAVRRTRFAPGERLGVAVKSQITIEIGFAEINRGVAVSGRTY